VKEPVLKDEWDNKSAGGKYRVKEVMLESRFQPIAEKITAGRYYSIGKFTKGHIGYQNWYDPNF
jgi:hypothetical protein